MMPPTRFSTPGTKTAIRSHDIERGCTVKNILASVFALIAAVVFAKSPSVCEDGFTNIFNGRDLDGWLGATNLFYVENGELVFKEGPKNFGNLYYEKEFKDFTARFSFKLVPNGNNGFAVRAGKECVDGGALIGGNEVMRDAAYNGMEIQVLDDTGDKKQHLKPWQYHGSIYGVVAAQKGALRPVGEWNDEEVTVDGENVTVVLNGKTILATSVKDLPTDGTTPDGKPHPGLHNPSGYIGFLGHTMPVRFRNIRVKELNASLEGVWVADMPTENGFMPAFWIDIHRKSCGQMDAQLLYRWGVPYFYGWTSSCENGELVYVIQQKIDRMDAANSRFQFFRCRREGEGLKVKMTFEDGLGKEVSPGMEFVAHRRPCDGPAPDLSTAVYGESVALFENGISDWKVMDEKMPNYWSFVDGVLSNRVKYDDKGKIIHGVNLVTKRADFKDFNLKTEFRLKPHCNSGIYLRGIYEIQVKDSKGEVLDNRNLGALYGRITPTENAALDTGVWQTYDITLYKNHLTVVLNGRTVIDNKPVYGVTGGALTSDESAPGPIYLQGDHSDIDYRNMVLTPIVR